MGLSSVIKVKAKVNTLSNHDKTYLGDEFVCTILFQLNIKEAAIADDYLSNTILLKQEWVRFFVLFGVFIAQVL